MLSAVIKSGLTTALLPLLLLTQSGSSSVIRADVYSPTAPPSNKCRVGPGEEHHGVVNGSGSYWQYQTFKSSPYNPPELAITCNNGSLSSGLLLIAPSDTNPANPPVTKSPAPMILTDDGQLVWIGPVGPATVTNLHVTQYNNAPALIYWTGTTYVGLTFGYGWGSIKLLDAGYTEVLNFCPKVGLTTPDGVARPCEADVHESLITSRNNVLWVAYNITRTDLSSVGGPKDGYVLDNLIYETDPRTNKHLFRWSVLEHVPVNATKLPRASIAGLGTNASNALSYFQTNGVSEAGPDAYLLCSRHTSTVFLLDRATGAIRWRLDGVTGGDFGPLPAQVRFNWQHDARASDVTPTSMTLTFLDNDNARFDPVSRPSRAFTLRLYYPKHGNWSVTQVEDIYSSQRPLHSLSQGSHMRGSNGNRLVGYGVTPVMREFGPGGTPDNQDLRWEARFGTDNAVQQYRFWKQEWRATPANTVPSLFVDGAGSNGTAASADACRTAYVSWNGATGVRAWKVYQGASANQTLSAVAGSVPVRGFETSFQVGGGPSAKFVQVAAVLDGGREVRSNTVAL